MEDECEQFFTKLLILTTLQALLQVRAARSKRRRACFKRKRIDWEQRAELLEDTNRFTRCYKMSRESFDALLLMLSPSLDVDERQSKNRTGIECVTPANKLQMFLRYMSGGSYHDITAYSGVATTTYYDCVEQVMSSLLAHPDLQISFPDDEESLDALADGFQSVSNGGVMVGCVGAIDGWLCPIVVPRATEVPKVRSFFSGHYRCYGVNVQACCDHLSRFTSIAISSPGGTGDSVAFQEWGLSKIVKQFKFGRYVAGDNAYANDNSLLTPFPGPSVNGDIYKDSYNYHLSQLRIRIEMAFGLLVRKWGVFRTALHVSFPNVARVIMSGCILHNWCINRRLLEDATYQVDQDEVLRDALIEHRLSRTDDEEARDDSNEDDSPYRQLYNAAGGEVVSGLQRRERSPNLLRTAFVNKLQGRMQMRPQHNISRRSRESANQP